jgi:hypothetical protein
MGVLTPRLRTLNVSGRPINMSENFPVHLSSESHLTTNLSEVISEVLEPFDNFSKHPNFPLKYFIVRGVGGVPKYNFFDWNAHILLLRASCQVSEPIHNFSKFPPCLPK